MSRRVLVIRSCAFGDMVMLTAMFQALAEGASETTITMVSGGSWSRPVFDRSPYAGECHLLPSMRIPFALSPSKRTLARELRKSRWDGIWTWDDDPTLTFARRCRGDGVPFHSLADVPLDVDEHSVDHFLRFAGAERGAYLPRLTVRESDLADADAWLATAGLTDRRFVLLQPGNKKTMRRARRDRPSNLKYWPEARWTDVLRGVLDRDPDLVAVLCGVANERDLNDEISRGLPGDRVVNAAGDLPIPRLLGLFERATAMISVDTGPAHAAAAIGCPLVVMFGAMDPRHVAPRGTGPIRIVYQAGLEPLQPGQEWWAENCSMMGIEVDDVLSAWDDLRPGV